MCTSCKSTRFALFALALCTAVLPFAMPELCMEALCDGLRLCGGPLLVSLFPFLIVSALLAQSGAGETLGSLMRPVLRMMGFDSNAAGAVLITGLLGGFAPAAVAASEQVRTGRLSPRQASFLLPACVCSGPSFVILTVGERFLGSRTLGIQLYLSQLLAGYLIAALFYRLMGRYLETCSVQKNPLPLAPQLDRLIAESALRYVQLCGFVVYFRMLAVGMAAILPPAWGFLPAMLLEVSSGCDLASRTGLWASPLCCAALSLQGASVLLQVRSLCPAEVSLKPLLAARILHLPLSLSIFALSLPQKAQETFSTLCKPIVPMRRVPLDCALIVFFGCCLLCCELCRTAQQINCKNKHSDVASLSQL